MKLKWIQAAVLTLSSVLTLAIPSSKAQSEEIVIRGGWLFDGIGEARVRNTGIVVRNGKFIRVGVDLTGRDLSRTRVIDLDDEATILPGMVDMHAHLNMNLVSEGRAEEVVYNPIVFLANGVTAIWPGGEYFPERTLEARKGIDSDEAIGARIFPSGPYFGAFRCEYAIETAADDCAAWPNNITEAQIRAEVDYWAERGVSSIKIKQATPEEMGILIDQAHKHGMTTTSHLGNYAGEFDVDPKEAIRMGLDRVEHWITRERGSAESPELGEMIDLFIEHNVYFDANLQMFGGARLRNNPALDMVWVDEAAYFTPYARTLLEQRAAGRSEVDSEESPSTRQRMKELRALYDAGGGHLIVVGTDEPVYGLLLPGFAYHRELQAMVYAGLPPAVVLKAATVNGARALGLSDRLGSIQTGKLADLFVANGNPLEDITAARKIRLVMKGGEVYDPGALLKSVEGQIGPSGEDDHGQWKLLVKPLGNRP